MLIHIYTRVGRVTPFCVGVRHRKQHPVCQTYQLALGRVPGDVAVADVVVVSL